MRKSKVKPLVAAYAVSLRKEGKKYNEIVELCAQIDKTESITLDWCKKELKGIEKEDISKAEQLCLEQITTLALMPKGITYVECYAIIAHNHNLQNKAEIYSLYTKYKAKVMKKEGTFFRPSSIQPDKASVSLNQLVGYVNVLYEAAADYVCDYCRENPDTYPSAVRRELASMVFPELNIMGGANRFSYLEKSVETLTERVPQVDKCDNVYNNVCATNIIDIEESDIPY